MQFSYQDNTESTRDDRSVLRKAKMVCTIGPASQTEERIRELMRAGMDVARLNFSHGTHEGYAAIIERLRRIAEQEGRSICILQDLQGPKIRTGRLKEKPVILKAGSLVTITPRDIAGDAAVLSTTFQTLAEDVEPGSRILLSDGRIELTVTAIHGADVECRVENGGVLGEYQGINIPGAILSIPAVTEKDLRDLAFGVEQKVDALAVSFVRTAKDVKAVRKALADLDADVFIIAKLEKPQAIEHLDEIFKEADGVMVARGDLGVEVAPEKVPVIQKYIIKRSQWWRKPVITATQMLESMIENPRPTRAEASDVANAIFDGSDAVMLSGETAAGKHPVEAASMMARIIAETESHIRLEHVPRRRDDTRKNTIAEAVCDAVSHAAEDLEMKAIAIYTESGNTARILSKHRPRTTVFGLTHRPEVRNRLNLFWGVHPIVCEQMTSTEVMVRTAEAALVQSGHAALGDIIGVVGGTRNSTGSTNFMRLHVVGGENAPERPARHDSEPERSGRG